MPAGTWSNEATADAQERRAAILKTKTLLWITVNPFIAYHYHIQTAYIREARAWCRQIIVSFDKRDRDIYARFLQDGVLTADDPVVFVDMNDESLATQRLLEEVRKLNIKIDGVYTAHEHALTMMGELNVLFRVEHTNPAEAYFNAKDKFKTRTACKAKGLMAPAYEVVSPDTPLSDALQTAEAIGYPLVLKPTSGAGSFGVHKCLDADDFAKYFENLRYEIGRCPILTKGNNGVASRILIEGYLEGDEFDADLLLWDGQLMYGHVIDNWPTFEPYFLETGSNSPSTAPVTVQQHVLQYAHKCALACGFRYGAFHIELKYSQKHSGPVLIEINPRIGGGRTRDLHLLTTKVDMLKESILCSLGIPINPVRIDRPEIAIAEYEISAEKTGVLEDNNYLDFLDSHKDLVMYKYTVPPLTPVVGMDTGYPNWVAHFMIKGRTPAEAVMHVREVLAQIKLPINTVDTHAPSR